MSIDPETPVVRPWSARRLATRNIRRGVLPEDEPDRSRTIKMARQFADQLGLIVAFTIFGSIGLLTAVLGHEEIWGRPGSAAMGTCWLSLAVVMFLRLRGARAVLDRVEAGNGPPNSGRSG